MNRREKQDGLLDVGGQQRQVRDLRDPGPGDMFQVCTETSKTLGLSDF